MESAASANNCKEHCLLGKKISVQGFRTKDSQKVNKPTSQIQGLPTRNWKPDMNQSGQTPNRTYLSSTNEQSVVEQEQFYVDEEQMLSNFGFLQTHFVPQHRYPESNFAVQEKKAYESSGNYLSGLVDGESIQPPATVCNPNSASLKLILPGPAPKLQRGNYKSEFYSSLVRTALLTQGHEFEDRDQNYRFNRGRCVWGSRLRP